MEITSPAFEHHKMIPKKYTCQGEDISPPLDFKNVPENALSLVLIMDDPDAPGGVFDHWIVWNIPPKSHLKEGESGLTVGLNSYRVNQYRGPCPPIGKDHRYFFKLYALDTVLSLPQNIHKRDLEMAIENHVIASATLVGLFKRD